MTRTKTITNPTIRIRHNGADHTYRVFDKEREVFIVPTIQEAHAFAVLAESWTTKYGPEARRAPR